MDTPSIRRRRRRRKRRRRRRRRRMRRRRRRRISRRVTSFERCSQQPLCLDFGAQCKLQLLYS
jgi:hypothetical protein